MKSAPKLWWSTSLADIHFCFVCGGPLDLRMIPSDIRKRHICRVCGHIMYLNPKSVAGLIPVMPDGRLALLQREIDPGRGKWSYPAGYQELGETVRDAAARETWEEICVKPTVDKLLNIYSYKDSAVITTIFVGRVLRRQSPKPGHESRAVRLYEPNKIPWGKLAFQSTVDALREYVETL
jgi:ADP-ribose pyrophosphatase YjhB (NUDIX family)